jgi:hypothetical protein
MGLCFEVLDANSPAGDIELAVIVAAKKARTPMEGLGTIG